eukprot:scaffold11849_cov130-Isochrysis_galbana.AAC.5
MTLNLRRCGFAAEHAHLGTPARANHDLDRQRGRICSVHCNNTLPLEPISNGQMVCGMGRSMC